MADKAVPVVSEVELLVRLPSVALVDADESSMNRVLREKRSRGGTCIIIGKL